MRVISRNTGRAGSKWATILLALIISVVFGIVGLVAMLGLAHQVSDWWQARHWVSTQANVLEVNQEQHHSSKGRRYYTTNARYQYTVNGVTHVGTRIDINTSSDNETQQTQYDLLALAKLKEQTITIWVDIGNPDRSVVERQLRWSSIGFLLPFAVLFPLFALTALWILINTLTRPAKQQSTTLVIGSHPTATDSDASDGRSYPPIPARIASVIDEFSSLTITFNPSAERLDAMLMAIFGALFAGVGFFIVKREIGLNVVSTTMGTVFCAIGVGLLALSAHTLTNKMILTVTQGRLLVSNQSMFRTRRDDVEITNIVSLIPYLRRAGKNAHYYQIIAAATDCRTINLCKPIYEAGVVTAILRLLQRHLRLQNSAVGSVSSADAAEAKRQEGYANQTGSIDARKRLMRVFTAIPVLMLAFFAWQAFSIFSTINSTPVVAPNKIEPSVAELRRADQALFDALENSHPLAQVSAALAQGANINATNHWGATPLIVAAQRSNADVGFALLHAGANINFSITIDNEYQGRTALMSAAHAGNSKFVAMLLDAGAEAIQFERHGWSALHFAAREDSVATLQVFHQYAMNMDVHSPTNRGETPLMIAASFGQGEAIRALIRFGADPLTKDSSGENAYDWAKYFHQTEAMAALQAYE